ARARAGGEDWVERHERGRREVHLCDEPAREGRSEQREVDVRRPPGVVVVAPRVRARLDGDEAVFAAVVGEASARTREVGVEWRRMFVARVEVPASGVRLLDLDALGAA